MRSASVGILVCVSACALDWSKPSERRDSDAEVVTDSSKGEDPPQDVEADAARGGGASVTDEDAGVTNKDASVTDEDASGQVNCDEDLDGFLAARSDCDAMRKTARADCDDRNQAIFPGARVTCGDGLNNDCSGWDEDATRFLKLAEAGFLPEQTAWFTQAGTYVRWSFAAGRTGNGPARGFMALLEQPSASSNDNDATLRLLSFEPGAPAIQKSANVTRPSDLRNWGPVPAMVASGERVALHAMGTSSVTSRDLPLRWEWDGAATSSTTGFRALPTECEVAAAGNRPLVAAEGTNTAALLGPWSTGHGTLMFAAASYTRCAAASSANMESLMLVDNHLIVGGAKESVLVWNGALANASVLTYALVRNRVGLYTPLFTSDGIAAASPSPGTVILAYASAAGVTLEHIDAHDGEFARVRSIDITVTGMGLREIRLNAISNGILLTLGGDGAADSQGNLRKVLRMLLIRTSSELSVLDVREALLDDVYAPTEVQVVGPSASQPWYSAYFARHRSEVSVGEVRYCLAL